MLSKRLFDAIASAVDLDDPAEQSLDVVGFENTDSVQIKMRHQCSRSPVAQVGRLFTSVSMRVASSRVNCHAILLRHTLRASI